MDSAVQLRPVPLDIRKHCPSHGMSGVHYSAGHAFWRTDESLGILNACEPVSQTAGVQWYGFLFVFYGGKKIAWWILAQRKGNILDYILRAMLGRCSWAIMTARVSSPGRYVRADFYTEVLRAEHECVFSFYVCFPYQELT